MGEREDKETSVSDGGEKKTSSLTAPNVSGKKGKLPTPMSTTGKIKGTPSGGEAMKLFEGLIVGSRRKWGRERGEEMKREVESGEVDSKEIKARNRCHQRGEYPGGKTKKSY